MPCGVQADISYVYVQAHFLGIAHYDINIKDKKIQLVFNEFNLGKEGQIWFHYNF